MAKKDSTSFIVSSNLKTALAAKNLVSSPDVNEVYYNGSNEIHFLVADLNDGTFSCIISGSGGTEFDKHSIDDPAYIRRFLVKELQNIIGNYPNVASSTTTQQGANFTHRIIHNGVERIGTSQNLADAHALAFIAVLNAS